MYQDHKFQKYQDMTCYFPITRYQGENTFGVKEWTEWPEGNSWLFFHHPRDTLLEDEPFKWEPGVGLATPENNWGAFTLVGLLQIEDDGNIPTICGQVCLQQNDLNFFQLAGTEICQARNSRDVRNTGPPMQWVHCIPGTGKGANLTLVAINDKYNTGRVEVYFLRARNYELEEESSEQEIIRSQLPGMKEFYFRTKINKVFSSWWNFFCG